MKISMYFSAQDTASVITSLMYSNVSRKVTVISPVKFYGLGFIFVFVKLYVACLQHFSLSLRDQVNAFTLVTKYQSLVHCCLQGRISCDFILWGTLDLISVSCHFAFSLSDY